MLPMHGRLLIGFICIFGLMGCKTNSSQTCSTCNSSPIVRGQVPTMTITPHQSGKPGLYVKVNDSRTTDVIATKPAAVSDPISKSQMPEVPVVTDIATPAAPIDGKDVTPSESNIRKPDDRGFKTITGELVYSARKKEWRLRYAGLDVEDQFGGSVTLTETGDLLKDYRDGDKVKVEGELLNESRSISPFYKLKKVSRIN